METQLQSTANTAKVSAYNKARLALQWQRGKTDERGQKAAEWQLTWWWSGALVARHWTEREEEFQHQSMSTANDQRIFLLIVKRLIQWKCSTYVKVTANASTWSIKWSGGIRHSRVDVQLVQTAAVSLGTPQACGTGSLWSRLPRSSALEFLLKNEMSLPEPAFFCFLSPGETWTNVSVLAGNGLSLGDEGVAVPEWDWSVTSVKTPGVTTGRTEQRVWKSTTQTNVCRSRAFRCIKLRQVNKIGLMWNSGLSVSLHLASHRPSFHSSVALHICIHLCLPSPSLQSLLCPHLFQSNSPPHTPAAF